MHNNPNDEDIWDFIDTQIVNKIMVHFACQDLHEIYEQKMNKWKAVYMVYSVSFSLKKMLKLQQVENIEYDIICKLVRTLEKYFFLAISMDIRFPKKIIDFVTFCSDFVEQLSQIKNNLANMSFK